MLELARSEREKLGHARIYPEHILVGIVAEYRNVGAAVLRDFEIDLESLRRAIAEVSIEDSLDAGVVTEDDYAWVTRVLLNSAQDVMKTLGDLAIGPEHLLIAFLKEEERAFLLFNSPHFFHLHIDVEQVRARVIEYLGTEAQLRDPPSLRGKTIIFRTKTPEWSREVIVAAQVEDVTWISGEWRLRLLLPDIVDCRYALSSRHHTATLAENADMLNFIFSVRQKSGSLCLPVTIEDVI